MNNTKGYSVGGNWEQTKKHFIDWAREISIELLTPTGWDTFESESYLEPDIDDLNEKFSEADKVLARQSLKVLKEKLTQLELPIESIKIIEKKLDDLDEKIDTLSKFDWKSFLIGTIASLILVLSIPQDSNGLIWEYVKTAFNNIRISK
ncbi:MAG: hypothetical protein L3J29_03885 [Cyclobacteriaceae bacterium]|nr:hypothetical protein [Cyclobacteriaceae bacterium]